jgi:hypothetical protein
MRSLPFIVALLSACSGGGSELVVGTRSYAIGSQAWAPSPWDDAWSQLLLSTDPDPCNGAPRNGVRMVLDLRAAEGDAPPASYALPDASMSVSLCAFDDECAIRQTVRATGGELRLTEASDVRAGSFDFELSSGDRARGAFAAQPRACPADAPRTCR